MLERFHNYRTKGNRLKRKSPKQLKSLMLKVSAFIFKSTTAQQMHVFCKAKLNLRIIMNILG
jgi:hypothetical protein